MGGIAIILVILESFQFESQYVRWVGETILDKVSGHGSSATLGMYAHHLDGVTFVHIKEWLDDLHFLFHSFPVKEVFELLGGKMDEYAIISLYCLYELIGEQRLPKGKEILAICRLQLHLSFHAVWVNPIQRSEHSI